MIRTLQGLVAAQAEAVLALVEQQRIANLIALAALDADTGEKEHLSREAALALIEYRGGPMPYLDEALVTRPEIAAALGIEAGETRE